MKPTLAALFAACAVAATGPLAAQELKIGVVNSERLLRDSAPAKAAQARLDAEFTKRDRDLTEMENRLKAASEKLRRDDPTIAESERSRRQRELVEQDREVQRKRREFQEDVNQRRNEERTAVLERADRAIRQIVEQEKYDLILQDAVFYAPRVDITDKVIRALNAPAPAPAAK